MRTELHIAWRYLFAKKQYNAIHIISIISAAAVGVVTAAMICVMSVMNGFGTMIENMFSQFDPDIRITASSGKSFHLSAETQEALFSLECISQLSQTIEETALVQFEEKQVPVRLHGVDSIFPLLTNIQDIITDGEYTVYDGAFDRAVLGRGLAWKIGIGARFIRPLHLYAPKRVGKVNMLRPDQNFNEEICYIAGTFAVQQVEYDDNVMLVDIDLTRRLLDYAPNEVSALLVQLTPGTSTKIAKKELQKLLGPDYLVLNKHEQHADFFRLLKVEKLLTVLLLAFILLIASFNIIGSLTMLIIDKKKDIQTLSHLGASKQTIRRIFLFEGWMISSLGAFIGLIVGLVVCLAQQHLGLLKLGNGTEYNLAAYPVAVEGMDVLLITVIVLLLGILAAWIPASRLEIKSQDN